VAALFLLRHNARRATRLLAAAAVAGIIWAWGAAQYPYLLPESLTISAAAGAPATLGWRVVVVVGAVVLVVPSLILVFRLHDQSRLEENPLEVHMSQNGTHALGDTEPRVVIVGGGFGGIAAAKALPSRAATTPPTPSARASCTSHHPSPSATSTRATWPPSP
jgi:hypothetical protein